MYVFSTLIIILSLFVYGFITRILLTCVQAIFVFPMESAFKNMNLLIIINFNVSPPNRRVGLECKRASKTE